MLRPPPKSPLFPYTTLFRSGLRLPAQQGRIGSRSASRFQYSCLRLREEPRVWRRRHEYWNRLARSEEHTSELQSHVNLVCRLLLEKKKTDEPTAALAYRRHY